MSLSNKLSATTEKKSDAFRDSVAKMQSLTSAKMQQVNQTILDNMQSDVALIPQMAAHLIGAGGKRLRPILTLAAAGCFNYQDTDDVKLAAAVEIIHAATLLHDDVVDESNMRRGKATANDIWGNKESVLVGDFLFSRAFELMVQTRDIKVLGVLSHASAVIAEGEVLQLQTQKNINATVDMYLAVIKAKTAALFAAAAKTGAMVASDDKAIHDAFFDFGMDLGIAFQIVDDALDYAGDATTIGKSVGDDFMEGKMTLPVIFAIQHADDEEKQFWQRTLGEGNVQEQDLEQAIIIMQREETIQKSMQMAKAYVDKAAAALEIVPNSDMKTALLALNQAALLREF